MELLAKNVRSEPLLFALQCVIFKKKLSVSELGFEVSSRVRQGSGVSSKVTCGLCFGYRGSSKVSSGTHPGTDPGTHSEIHKSRGMAPSAARNSHRISLRNSLVETFAPLEFTFQLTLEFTPTCRTNELRISYLSAAAKIVSLEFRGVGFYRVL